MTSWVIGRNEQKSAAFRSPAFGLREHVAEAMKVAVHIRDIKKMQPEVEEPIQLHFEHGARCGCLPYRPQRRAPR